jgi:hypothetical protein
MPFSREGFDTIGFEESVWKRVGGGKYAEDIYVSSHVDDCLIACKSKDIMAAFKKEILTRFVGTDEGEVTEYLGCELIRNRSAKTATIVQKGYAERDLKITGCLSYLVNMTRPDLAFAYCQLRKFVQYPGVVHLQVSERVLQYVCGTYDQGITYCDLIVEVKNKLIGWVDSDFGSDPDTRKSMTCYLMSLNGGAISWISSSSEKAHRNIGG